MCDGDRMSVESCPGGTVWDDIEKACSWPDKQTTVSIELQTGTLSRSTYGNQYSVPEQIQSPKVIQMFRNNMVIPKQVSSYGAPLDIPKPVASFGVQLDLVKQVSSYDAPQDFPKQVSSYGAQLNIPKQVSSYGAQLDLPKLRKF